MDILQMHPIIEDAYHDPGFILIIETHLTLLRNATGAKLLPVTEQQGYKYEGDFYGLLDDLKIEKKYHLVVLRVNDLLSSADYKGDMSHVILPSISQVELLKSIFQTSDESSD